MAPISINGSTGISGVDGSAAAPALQGSDTNTGIAFGSDVIIGSTDGTERFRCDSSGRIGLGVSSPDERLVVSGAIRVTSNAANWAASDGAVVDYNAGDMRIVAARTGSNSSNIQFHTYNSGTAAERMRIGNDGRVGIGTTASTMTTHVPNLGIYAGTQGTDNTCVHLASDSSGSGTRGFLICSSNYTSSRDTEFALNNNGQAYADGSWNGGGADYAEYFEWSDSNLDKEDRRGISVVLDGNKIREAQAGEDPIGVISGNPSVVGDAAWNKWSGKYLRDEFGTYILEDYEVEDQNGNTVVQQRRKLNPAYDPDQEYIPREQRPEWDCVGLMGKLRIRKGQVTGSRWIKMRDISDSVEEWLVR